jgi:hypothetical protein
MKKPIPLRSTSAMSRVNGVDKWMSGGRLPTLSVEAVLEEDVSMWKSELVDRMGVNPWNADYTISGWMVAYRIV